MQSVRTLSSARSLWVWFYLSMAAVGLIWPWTYNVAFFQLGGSIAPGPFFDAAFANALTTAITVDVYLSALVFSAWILQNSCRAGVPRPWLYILLCFAVGLSFAFPLYLARCEASRPQSA